MRTHWLVLLVSVAGCASTSSSSPLPLRQVVLYRSGMGHFEHAGRLKSSHLQLRLRSSEVDDVIKTIAVTSKDDGAVLGAVAALKPRGTDGGLSLDLTVASSKEITLSYAVPTPVWRSTHRLVLGEGDSALLQTWAMVDNASDEDWRDVRLTLATGAPLSFAVDLHTAQFVARPDASGQLVRPVATGLVAGEKGRPGDADGDGIADDSDLCPREAEDGDGFEDGDGCPDSDNDKDRIRDAADKCPNEPETYNGFADDDGCPDKGRVIVRRGKVEILDKIYFPSGKREIPAVAGPLLDAIAATLKGNPQILSLEVAGHASANEGDSARLAAARGAAVREALVARDVAGARLVGQSYGSTRPLCTQKNEDCHSQNRRVEFMILKRREEAAVAEADEPAVETKVAALERSVPRAPAAAKEVAGMVRYAIQVPVTIPARSSAMVAIQNRRLPGAEVYLYRPDPAAPGTDRHPFRAARFQLPPGVELEAGPLAVYARGTFVGDALVERLHPGEVSFVPFAVDGSTSVEVTREDRAVPSRLVKIDRGAMTVEDREIRRTSYEVTAGDSAPTRIFVRHEVAPGYRVSQLPTGSIDGVQAHLVPFSLRSAAKTTLALEEERPAQRVVRPLDGHKVDLELYLKGSPNLPAPIADQLRRAAALLVARGKLSAEEGLARRHLTDSTRRMSELRESLLSIEKNPTAAKLRAELTQRLTQATRSHEDLEKKLAQLGAESDEKRAQLRAILQDLTLEDAGPPAL